MTDGYDPTRPKFFGRRKGRPLSASQQTFLEDALPGMTIDPASVPNSIGDLFSGPVSDVWMEVGFGSGEHLVALAQSQSDIGFIGCEPFINGVAKAVRDAKAAGLSNVLIYPDDARQVLDALPEASLGRVYVLFPDPWPKKRHRMRRFVGPDNLPSLARVIRPGGELRCATDHPDYLDWMLFHITANSDFTWLAETPEDWRRRPADQPPTRYETKALAGQPHYLRFQRT